MDTARKETMHDLSNYPPGVSGNEPEIQGGPDPEVVICRHCTEPIMVGFVAADGTEVWVHVDNGHTVCNWHEDMEPTSIVAEPAPLDAILLALVRTDDEDLSARHLVLKWVAMMMNGTDENSTGSPTWEDYLTDIAKGLTRLGYAQIEYPRL